MRQMMATARLLAVLLTALLASPVAAAELLGPVRVCDGTAEWPPYIYYQREGENAGRLVGFSLDVLREVIKPEQLSIEVSLQPWRTCLNETANGKRDVILNATSNPVLNARFLQSRAYYTTTPSYVYSTSRFPQGMEIEAKEDLREYKGCGVSGRDYSRYHIPEDRLDTNSPDITSALRKLLEGRCDYVPISYEPFSAYTLTGEPYATDPALAHAPVPGMSKLEHHMLFPINPRGEQLRNLVDEGLKRLIETGRMHALLKKYELE